MLFQVQNTLYHGWQSVSNTDKEGNIILTSDKLALIYKSVLSACDPKDGLIDGLISQPALCDFNPSTLICSKEKNTSECLTEKQAVVVQKFYDGPRDQKSGAHLTAGQPIYGSELNWQGVYVSDSATEPLFSSMAALPVLKYLAFEKSNPDFKLENLDFTEATLQKLQARHSLFDATNTDLNNFANSGKKLILWHGLADPHISPANTVAYHEALVRDMGEESVLSFERLYLFPGMSHCSGGQGPSRIDLLTPMIRWVEHGIAPNEIIASSKKEETSSFGRPDFGDKKKTSHGMPVKKDLGIEVLPNMTRPVYPYPYTAHYKGSGDMYDANNWEKGAAGPIAKTHDWPGYSMFGHYTFTK